MNLALLGNQVLNYTKENAASLVATAATAAGWTTAAVVGGKGAVVGVCLVGGGMFATLVTHEILTTTAKMAGGAFNGIKDALSKMTEKTPPNIVRRETHTESRIVTESGAPAAGKVPM